MRPASAREMVMPIALKMGEGSEPYKPLACALIGGLSVPTLFTVFWVPAGFLPAR
jgi:multidrug efflux pump subunit AcrB